MSTNNHDLLISDVFVKINAPLYCYDAWMQACTPTNPMSTNTRPTSTLSSCMFLLGWKNDRSSNQQLDHADHAIHQEPYCC